MRVMYWLFLALLIIVLIMDFTCVWMVRNRVITAVDIAVDAAIIKGIYNDDAYRGNIMVDETKVWLEAKKAFRENLKLNQNLENKYLHDTKFGIALEQNRDKTGIRAEVRTTIDALTPKIIGMQGYEVTIHKIQYYLCRYK